MSDVGSNNMCLRWTLSLSNMRNYKRAKPRFGGTVLRTGGKLLGAEPEPRQRERGMGIRCGAAEDNTEQRGRGMGRRKGEKEKEGFIEWIHRMA